MEQVPPRPGSWWLMTPDDDEFAKWGHIFSSSHGRGLLQRMQSADLPDKMKWNKKSLQFRTLTPHLEVPSAQRLTVCTAVSLAWCPRPSPAATPTLPGPSGATASSPQQLSRILAAEEWTREHWHWHLTPTTLYTHLINNIALFNCQTLPMSARECCGLIAVVTLQLAGTRAGTLGRWHSIIKTSVIRSEEWF